MFSKLVAPHGGRGLVCALLEDGEREAELKVAAGLKQIEISARTKGDLIMMGIGGFSPLDGFMTKADVFVRIFRWQMAPSGLCPLPWMYQPQTPLILN